MSLYQSPCCALAVSGSTHFPSGCLKVAKKKKKEAAVDVLDLLLVSSGFLVDPRNYLAVSIMASSISGEAPGAVRLSGTGVVLQAQDTCGAVLQPGCPWCSADAALLAKRSFLQVLITPVWFVEGWVIE